MERGRKIVRVGESGNFAMRLCFLEIAESMPVKSCQHDFPNLTWTKRTPMSMPNWMGRVSGGPNPTRRTTENWVKFGEEGGPPWRVILPRGWSSPEKSTPVGCSVLNGQPWKHTHNNSAHQHLILRIICIYLCKCICVYVCVLILTMKKESMHLKETREGYMGELWGRKERKGKL